MGRGAYTESFPLFGLPLDRYEELFEGRLGLFAALVDEQPVTRQCTMQSPLTAQHVHPGLDAALPAWVGVGGNPESAIRAARYGLPVEVMNRLGRERGFSPLSRERYEADATAGTLMIGSPETVAPASPRPCARWARPGSR